MPEQKPNLDDRVDAYLLGTCFQDLVQDPYLIALIGARHAEIPLDAFIGEADAILDIEAPGQRRDSFRALLERLVKAPPATTAARNSFEEQLTL